MGTSGVYRYNNIMSVIHYLPARLLYSLYRGTVGVTDGCVQKMRGNIRVHKSKPKKPSLTAWDNLQMRLCMYTSWVHA